MMNYTEPATEILKAVYSLSEEHNIKCYALDLLEL